jgi:general secretion pathway protein D
MKLRTTLLMGILCATPMLGAAQGSASKMSGGVELLRLIETVAKSSGKRFIIDPRVRGDVQMAGLDAEKLSYEQLLAILRLNQLVAVEEAGLVNVFPDVNARQFPTVTLYADDPKLSGETLVTWIAQARNVCVTWAIPVLRPLMPQQAHLAAYPPTNAFIISDRLANARRIVAIVESLDKASNGKQDCGEHKDATAK